MKKRLMVALVIVGSAVYVLFFAWLAFSQGTLAPSR